MACFPQIFRRQVDKNDNDQSIIRFFSNHNHEIICTTYSLVNASCTATLWKAHLQVVYSGILKQGKSVGVSNDKMHYHHFVKALVVLCDRLNIKKENATAKILFLLDKYIIPFADDWNLSVWDQYRAKANTPSVCKISKSCHNASPCIKSKNDQNSYPSVRFISLCKVYRIFKPMEIGLEKVFR